MKKYEKDFENDLEKCPQWIKNEVKTLKDKLEDFIFLKHRTSGNILTKSRLIRQFDKRTINHRDSTYRSLIANLINQFRSSIDNNKPFNFNLNSHEGLEKQSIDQASQKIKNLFEEIDNEKYYEKLDCEFVSYKKLFKHNYLELLNSKEYPDIENFKSNKIRTFQNL